MTFNYTVSLTDQVGEPAAVENGLVTDLKGALAEWSQYINAAPGATLNVTLDITESVRRGRGGRSQPGDPHRHDKHRRDHRRAVADLCF